MTETYQIKNDEDQEIHLPQFNVSQDEEYALAQAAINSISASGAALQRKLTESEKIESNVQILEQQILEQVLPSELNIDYSNAYEWIKQPIAFVFGLSFKIQFYLIILFLLTVFIVIPVIQHLFRKIWTFFDPIRFNMQHVLIIGGSDGLGKELVKEVFMKGALVTIIGRDEEKMKAILEELDYKNEGDPLIRYYVCDITTIESYEVEKILRYAEKFFGQIEMMISCAASSEPVMFVSSDLNKFRNQMDINFFSQVKFLIPITKRMVMRKTQGRVCLVGDSTATQLTIPGMTPYACSKSALDKLAFQLKAELEVHGIQIHYFLPPPMDTQLLKTEKKLLPPPTKQLFANRRAIHPSWAAKKLMRGISMNEFIIPGGISICFVSSLLCQYSVACNVIMAPVAICFRAFQELKVQNQMQQYRPFRSFQEPQKNPVSTFPKQFKTPN